MSLSALLEFWFPNEQLQEFWFDGSKDYEIQEKFYELLKIYESNMDIATNTDDIFGKIILFDQITRNISRLTNENYKRNDKYALNLAKLEIVNDIKYPLYKRIFLLLPFRHSRTTLNLNFVIEKLNSYTEDDKKTNFYQKFYQATLKDYSKVTDTIKITSVTFDHHCHPLFNPTIHDAICEKYNMEQLENLKDKNIKIYNNRLYKSIEKFTLENNIKRMCISLSGGVDSNVMLYIFYQMYLARVIDLLVCVHVDYANRETSKLESDYLINVCKFFDVPIITRRIEHMNRSNQLNKQFYEEETKKIRFGLYEYAKKEYNIQGICLGHHKDDLNENVCMNILRGKNFLDLFVMKSSSVSDNVLLLRPMLDHHKTDIYEIAHKYNIMYFIDVTPETCLRGIVRKKIFPAIEDFDKNMIQNIHIMGNMSNEWSLAINNLIILPILNSLELGKSGFKIKFSSNFNSLPSALWSKLLAKIFHSNNSKMISNGSLKTFINWTNNKSRNTIMCNLSNGFIACCNLNTIYFFSFSKIYFPRQPLQITYTGTNSITHYGNWKIILSPTIDYIKTPMNLDDLLKGEFSYTKPINKNRVFNIQSNLDHRDSTRKIFGKLNKINTFVPKTTSFILNDKILNTEFVEITIKMQ